jgi:hypothetical protein
MAKIGHMSRQKRNLLIVCAVACVYFALFIPVNLRCSGDENMLLCTGPDEISDTTGDEYAQFPHLMSMMMRDTTLLGTVQRVLDQQHYYYGYPFYFVSAVAVLPVRVLSEFREGDYTRMYVLLLRQLSPLFTATAIVLLVAMWTRFENLVASLSMFAFLSAIPAVFRNNTWWHPDAMVMFLVVLTLFSLDRDGLRFGKWFLVSAIACGLATATKTIGVFFVAAIPLYLIIGIYRRQLTPPNAFKAGILFVLTMAISILVSYPIMVLRSSQILETLQSQSAMNNFGWDMQRETGPLSQYREVLREGFGLWPIYILPFVVASVYGKTGDEKLRSVLTLAWVLPFAAYLLLVVARKQEHYFIPIMLPFLAVMWCPSLWQIRNRMSAVVVALLAIGLSTQMSIYLLRDVTIYGSLAALERTSPSIVFYHAFVQDGGLPVSPEIPVAIFRDAHVYLPPNPKYHARMKWGSADYSDVSFNPDLIILQQDLIQKHSDPLGISVSFDKEQARRSLTFYTDAKNNQLKGYKRIFESEFAVAFRKSIQGNPPNQALEPASFRLEGQR